jgi:hypothetical protein
LGLIALLVLVALPVYLLRRPKPTKSSAIEASPRADAAAVLSAPEPLPAAAPPEPPANNKRVAFAEPKTAKCTPRGGRATTERCDRLTAFEDALARSIRDNFACAPPSAAPYTVSFVLTVDFDRKSTHLWAGRSGSIKKRMAADLIRCVEHALVPPDWATIPHQFQKYDVNLIAAYPGNQPAAAALGGTPNAALGAPANTPSNATLGTPGAAGAPPLGAPPGVATATTIPAFAAPNAPVGTSGATGYVAR